MMMIMMEFPSLWRLSLLQAMVVVVVVMLVRAGTVVGDTTDFSNPITCYSCRGAAENSSCADPLDPRTNVFVKEKVCTKGLCLKWTKYQDGVLLVIRACSSDINFHLTMIDGVCRTERNGNGKLCMCGKHLCNAARTLTSVPSFLAILVAAYGVIIHRPL